MSRIHELPPEELAIYRRLDPERLPKHVAIIMDGNGRWAGKRRLKRFLGHQQGAEAVEGGHRHHMQAINAIRRAGSLRQAVETGILREGIMYECIKNNVEMVLAGSVRDDGPLPDVIMDMAEAQRRMREAVKGVAMALIIATMLHSIATGNLLPASVKVVAVDINPAVVTKLADRGTFQALGLVTDAELFVRELAQALKI